eukprot:m.221373 g.221373  ORF g.221373 m.221373 type:complete len:455 (-) comp10571_c0_seq1:123-1487(-)
MNMVEQTPAVAAHLTNAKVNIAGRPAMADEVLPSPNPPVDGHIKPSGKSSGQPLVSGPALELSTTAALEEFKTFEEISVDPATSEILVKVPSELVGRMIGKGGLVIKELQSHSGAFINMAKEGEVHRIARISGNYPETHLCALMLVARFTPREDTRKHERLDALIAAFKKLRPLKPFVVENFNVPAEHVGRIIGRGGHMIRELQEQSHAKIDIPKAYPGIDSHRVLTISGSPEEVAACRELLRARISTLDSRDGHQDSIDGSFAFHDMAGGSYVHPFSEGRFVNGGMYPAGFPFYQMPLGVETLAYSFPPYVMPYPVPFHPDLSADMQRVSLSPSLDSQDGDHHGDHQVPLMHPPSHPAAALHAAAPMFVPSVQCESIVAVPADLVGRLIGRQGVAVKQLQAETKTRVDVLDPTPGADHSTRFVRITALRPEHVRACEAHIKARIAAHYGSAFA